MTFGLNIPRILSLITNLDGGRKNANIFFQFSNWQFSNATGSNFSMEVWIVCSSKMDLFVNISCCVFDGSLLLLFDGNYRSATAPLFSSYFFQPISIVSKKIVFWVECMQTLCRSLATSATAMDSVLSLAESRFSHAANGFRYRRLARTRWCEILLLSRFRVPFMLFWNLEKVLIPYSFLRHRIFSVSSTIVTTVLFSQRPDCRQ